MPVRWRKRTPWYRRVYLARLAAVLGIAAGTVALAVGVWRW